jgi:hypothetical protein
MHLSSSIHAWAGRVELDFILYRCRARNHASLAYPGVSLSLPRPTLAVSLFDSQNARDDDTSLSTSVSDHVMYRTIVAQWTGEWPDTASEDGYNVTGRQGNAQASSKRGHARAPHSVIVRACTCVPERFRA